MPPVPMIPLILNAGQKYTWTVDSTDYPASTYTLYYVLINSTTKISFNSTASGDSHVVTLDDTTTAAYTAGTYLSFSYFSDGTDKFDHEKVTVEIKPNYITATTSDTRSTVRKWRDDIKAVIDGRMQQSDITYEIAGRSVTKMKHTELLSLYNWLNQAVKQEERTELSKAGRDPGGRYLVRYV